MVPFKYSSALCQAYFENFSGICVTLKIASPSRCSSGALGIEPFLDFSPQSWKVGYSDCEVGVVVLHYTGREAPRQQRPQLPKAQINLGARSFHLEKRMTGPISFNLRIFLNSCGDIIKSRSQYWNMCSLSSSI